MDIADPVDGTRETNSAGERTFEAASGEQTREVPLCGYWKPSSGGELRCDLPATHGDEPHHWPEPLAKTGEFDARAETLAIIREARKEEPHDMWLDYKVAIENGLLRAYAAGRASSGRLPARSSLGQYPMNWCSRHGVDFKRDETCPLCVREAAPAPAQLSEEQVQRIKRRMDEVGREVFCPRQQWQAELEKVLDEELALLRSQPAGTKESK